MIVGTVHVYLIKNFEKKTSKSGAEVFVGQGLYENPVNAPGQVNEVLVRLYTYDASVLNIFGGTNYQNRLIAFSGVFRLYQFVDGDSGSDLSNNPEIVRRYEMEVRDWQLITKHTYTNDLSTTQAQRLFPDTQESGDDDPPVDNGNCKPDGNG